MLIKTENILKNINWKNALLVISVICFLLISSFQFYISKQQGEEINTKIDLMSNQLESAKSDIKSLDDLLSDTKTYADNAWSESVDANNGIGDLQSGIEDIQSAVDMMSYEIDRVKRSLNY